MRKSHFRQFTPFQANEDTQSVRLSENSEQVEELENVSPISAKDVISSTSYENSGNLPALVKNIVHACIARLQDPQPEGLSTRGLKAVKTKNGVLGLLPLLTLTCASGLLIVSFSYYLPVYGNTIFELFFFLGLLIMFVPAVVRLMSRAPSRTERVGILCVLGISLYVVQFMVSPLHVSSFDEFLHWRTADDIISSMHLFSQNPMLPVSPYYPGLEIVTSFLSSVSGLSVFHTGVIIISVSRLLMTLSLYLFYEQLTGSSRMGGLATVIYMTNSHFLFFDGLFNYETMSLSMATFLFYILVRYQTKEKDHRWILFTTWIVLLALTITHHMTDYVFDGFFMLWAIISLFVASPGYVRRNLAMIGFFGFLLATAYAFFMPGNPALEYLSSYFSSAFNELGQIVTGTSVARPLFVSSSGQGAPIWDRLLMLGSVAIVTFCLPFGLLCLWQQYRSNALSVMFGVAALGYPMTQAFRFTKFGAEITDRSASFLFIPVAYVLTIFITHFWPTRTLRWRETIGITSLISVVFLGGVTLESGPIWSNLPGPYIVVADVRSIEPEGIQVSLWANSHLGPNNRVSTDRINRLLMSTYGHQTIITGSGDKIDVSPVFYASTLGTKEIEILREAKVHYLVVDLRLSTSLPLDGFYFEEGEPGTFQLTKPISRAALTKFGEIPQIKQVFESGDIVIYDVSALVNGPST
jgi:hypothetical protein